MEDGPELAGLRWGGVKVPFSKTRSLKLSNTRLARDEDVVLSFVESPDPVWDPWHILCFFIDHCHPKATKVFARIIKPGGEEANRLRQAFGKDTWCACGGSGANWNMGPTKHRSLCKEIGRLSGVDKWESCTGHALRALCVTCCLECGLSNSEVAAKVRHASLNSSKTCSQETAKRKANRMAVMNPGGALTKKQKTSVAKSDSIVKLSTKFTKSSPDDDVLPKEIRETQPMLPGNRSRFEKLSGLSTKPVVESVAMVGKSTDEKENESPNSKLQRLEMENKILKLEHENARMKQELTGRLVAPVRHPHERQSFPPSYHHRQFESHPPFQEREFCDFPPDERHDNHCRRSYPPSRNDRSPPPPCYQPQHQPSRRAPHDDFGDGHDQGYHRRW